MVLLLKLFLVNVKGHNAGVGRNTCLEEGEYKESKMAFLGVNASLRTNESFRARNDDEYHKGNSPWNVCRLIWLNPYAYSLS